MILHKRNSIFSFPIKDLIDLSLEKKRKEGLKGEVYKKLKVLEN